MSEKPLPQIQLKYFKFPAQDDTGSPSFICFLCKKVKTRTGGGMDGHTSNPKIICEDCAIDRFMSYYGFENREAAIARRRRIFDIGYLFQEIIFDEYLKKHNRTYEEMGEMEFNSLFQMGQQLFNLCFTKRQKEKMEEIVDQSTIEDELRLKLSEALETIHL